ncbi:MAG: hypothetical protein IJB96_02785 [Lachnospira sp.]|nr:hypothetical protein [Lachnospira sp.]
MKIKNVSRVLGILCLMAMVGCSKQESVHNGADEALENPETIVSDLTQAEIIQEEVEIVNGYEKLVLNEALGDEGWCYVPYVNSRIPGVTYFYDDVRSWYRTKIYRDVNKPVGTTEAKIAANAFFAAHNTQPKFYDGKRENNPKQLILEGYENYSETEDREINILADKMDVRAVSLALYEDFYEDVPQLTVNIYGITRQMWNEYVGEKLSFQRVRYDKLLEMCENSNYSNCQLITSKKVDKTGVYYIDYKAMDKMGDFVQYIVEFEFDKSTEYTYNIHGSDTYSVTSETDYQAWKKNNMDRFISP